MVIGTALGLEALPFAFIKEKISLIRLILIILALLRPCLGMAQDTGGVIFPGVQPATESGLSQTNTSGTSAIFWNPANLLQMPAARPENKKAKKKKLVGIEFYGDLTLLNLNYSYARPGYDPVQLSQTAPPVNLGMAWRPQKKFAFGVLFVPRPGSSDKVEPQIKKVPFEVDKDVVVADVGFSGGSVVSGFSMALLLSEQFSLGVSVIENASAMNLSAWLSSSPDGVPLVQLNTKGTSMQYVLGGRVEPNDQTVIGFSIKPSATRNMDTFLSIAGSEPVSSTTSEYSPLEIAIGAEYSVDRFVYFGEYRRQGWAAGKSVSNSGLQGSGASTAYLDTNTFILGGRIIVSPNKTAGAAYGYYPSNLGIGTPREAAKDERVTGMSIGKFTGITRHMLSSHFKMEFRDSYLQTGFNFITGSRTVPAGYQYEGTHTINVFGLVLGGGYSL